MIKRPLQIGVNITTGYQESGDKVKDDCLRIDQTSYYLAAIFGLMNTAAKGYNLLELETDHQLFTFPEFLQTVEYLSEIGIGLVEQLTTYSVSITNAKTSEVKNV